MASFLSLTSAPINVYSKTFWTSYITAVNEEAAYELGLHQKINPEAVKQSTKKGWKASLFTPNILKHTDLYFDNSTNIDLSTHVHHHHHAAPTPTKPLTKEQQEEKKKKEEEDSLNKYKWVGPVITAIAAFASAYTWRGYQRSKATFDYTMQVKTNLKQCLTYEATPIKYTLERIVDLKLKVDEIRYSIIRRYFLACVGILIGGGLLTLAAYTHQPQLIPWGQLAIVVAAVWAAFSAGNHWHDNQEIRACYIAVSKRLGDQALSQLFYYYQENMTLLQGYYQDSRSFQIPPVGQSGGYQPYFVDTHFSPDVPPTVAPNYERGCTQLYPAHSDPYEYASAPPEGV